MKKLLVVACCLGALVLAGCSSDETPEAFGKKYIEKKFENINCDLLDLDYSVIEEGKNAATVIVEGTIKYKDEIYLVKKGEEWVVDKKNVEKVDTEKKAEAVKKVDAEKKADAVKKVDTEKKADTAKTADAEKKINTDKHDANTKAVKKEAHAKKAAPAQH